MGPRGRTAALRTERRSRSPPHPVMPAAKTKLGRDSREAAREKRPIFIRIGKPWSFWQRHWPACRSGWLWYSCTRGNTDRFPTARKAAGRNEASRSAFGKHSPSSPGNTGNAAVLTAAFSRLKPPASWQKAINWVLPLRPKRCRIWVDRSVPATVPPAGSLSRSPYVRRPAAMQ